MEEFKFSVNVLQISRKLLNVLYCITFGGGMFK